MPTLGRRNQAHSHNMTTPPSSLRIGLLDNACHSLQRGYEMLNKGRSKKEALALKEAIIWIHHGIELSLKQLLVQSNEYLVFENVDEAVRKLAHLRRQPDMNQATVLDLFDYGEGVYTVGFNKLVERAAIMLGLPEIAQGASLRERIDELTNYRNKIVHFSVEVQLDEVAGLLADLMEPFLTLLEREVKDENFVRRCIPSVRANAESVSAVYRLKYAEIEERISELMKKFDGQQVPGRLFGVDGAFTLPKFTNVEQQVGQQDLRADISATSNSERWIVEIKIGPPNSSQLHHMLDQLLTYKNAFQQQAENVKPWLIVMGADRVFNRSILKRYEVLFSSETDITELEQMLK